MIGFGLTRLLDFDLLARIKRINHLRFYLPTMADRPPYPNLAPALVQRGIDWDQWAITERDSFGRPGGRRVRAERRIGTPYS